ncbi:hypothetical protein ACBQ84_11605 [Escherichia ruysiae]|nr:MULTISPECIES: hypothetical protein [Escherichia]MBY7619234.1 hypothetical protein [Escherichia marmotae]MBA0991405.1 hypothetical protein [Escherichia coli]MBY7217925.1 hypothetical protein [Escherichia ruysiae]MBY7282694.1 hypothetical protein [Escherichia ruysiae]MBY7362151.1 hypothetical protein [Escherichia ruysiae]
MRFYFYSQAVDELGVAW